MSRGLTNFGEFKTTWHGDMRVQRSSAAFRGPCCFVFTTQSYTNDPHKNPPHLHLKLKDAIALRDALTEFIDINKDYKGEDEEED